MNERRTRLRGEIFPVPGHYPDTESEWLASPVVVSQPRIPVDG